ncbi:hypothetical protein C5167_005508 [Papaver somniferum]|uniref:Uncharacterized protein n=1 Tax=Papaver somniferum TaxID=3469 RepID=A0A4Y7JEI0_PAPSO|nr:hypothetical protein C5167_005508 [Papaver somniferum]
MAFTKLRRRTIDITRWKCSWQWGNLDSVVRFSEEGTSPPSTFPSTLSVIVMTILNIENMYIWVAHYECGDQTQW